MADFAPMTAYQGGPNMRRMKEGSKADQREDRKTGEGTKRDTEAVRKSKRTIAGGNKRPPIG